MKIIMDDMRFIDVKQLKTFLQGSQKVSLRVITQSEKYKCIQKAIRRLEYGKLKRSEKRIVINYLKKLTGYKRSQLLSLIQRALAGELVKKSCGVMSIGNILSIGHNKPSFTISE